jgi:putative ABC transport system substrate-binding protein
MLVIGYLDLGFPAPNSPFLRSLRQGLAESGFVEGQNVKFEFRWANTDPALLPQLAADLVSRKPAVIIATGSPASVLATKVATSTIPIVFATPVDPVKWGLVASLNRPSGNATGISFLTSALAGKQLNLLLDLVPKVTRVAYLSGPSSAPVFEDLKSNMLSAAHALGREMIVLPAAGGAELEAAFATLIERDAGALIVGSFSSLGHGAAAKKL